MRRGKKFKNIQENILKQQQCGNDTKVYCLTSLASLNGHKIVECMECGQGCEADMWLFSSLYLKTINKSGLLLLNHLYIDIPVTTYINIYFVVVKIYHAKLDRIYYIQDTLFIPVLFFKIYEKLLQ